MTAMYTPPEDGDPARSARRKACDLCFTKKIKCDMLKPVCSNCVLYQSECRTSIIRRKPNAAKARQAARVQREEENGRVEGLESRLARIEDQLQQVLNAAREARQPAPVTSNSSPESNVSAGQEVQEGTSSSDEALYSQLRLDDAAVNDWRFDPIEPCIYDGPQPESLSLPPMEEVIPIVDHFFVTHNTVIPLFHQPTFMKMLNAWYHHHTSRDKATWAAIQIVLALGYRTPREGNADTPSLQIQKANQCLKNAQSVVSELVTREEDLLGVQILLGIVLLFQNSRDPKPASVIIGTAVRLAHRLQLHSNEATRFYSPEEVEQRSRVFWIAYTLDKDLALRGRTPSAQFDDDIDVALPAVNPADGAGILWTQDGQNNFNYHRRRVELAHLEGRIYDLLYSNRAAKVQGQERQRRRDRLQAQLDQWYGRIPTVFQIDYVSSTVGPGQLIQMTKMHHAYLLAEVMTHGIYSHDADWVKRISSFSRAAIEELSITSRSFATESCYRDQRPPLPGGWDKCVEIARGCMKLFQEAIPTECLIWQCSCAHFSALIIILANMSLNPSHQFVSVDQTLAAKALVLFDRLLELVDSRPFQILRGIIDDLHRTAQAAVESERLDKGDSGNEVFDDMNRDLSMTHPVEQLDFLPLSDDLDTFGGTFEAIDMSEEFAASSFGQLPGASAMLGEMDTMSFPQFMEGTRI